MSIKKKIFENLLISLVVFVFVAVFRFKLPFWLLAFGLGGIVGSFIMELDYLVYIFFLEPKSSISIDAAALINRKKFNEAVALIRIRKEEVKYRIFHTYLFEGVFLAVVFYVLTSTDSAFGCGVAFFAFLHMLVDQFEELSKNNVLSPLWRGFLAIDIPERFQRVWLGVGSLVLIFFFVLLVR